MNRLTQTNKAFTVFEILIVLIIISLSLSIVGIKFLKTSNHLENADDFIQYLNSIAYLGKKKSAINSTTLYFDINMYEKFVGLCYLRNNTKVFIRKKYYSQSKIDIRSISTTNKLSSGSDVTIPIFPDGFVYPFTIDFTANNKINKISINPFSMRFFHEKTK